MSRDIPFADLQHVYFVGIGGIGMSALARYFRERGIRVSGYDRSSSDLTVQLEAEGIAVHYEDRPEALPKDLDLVVYTPAVPADMEELVALRSRSVPVVKRAEALGIIAARHRTLAVAGTHGKTTTSTLCAHILKEAGRECPAFLGGLATNYKSNYLSGTDDWLVVEADEYDRSFLHLQPEVAIITYIEPDHLDIYGAEEAFVDSFREFASRVVSEGTIVTKPHIVKALGEHGAHKVITYGVGEGEYSAEHVRVEDGAFVFDLRHPEGELKGLRLGIPGRHNVENAVAAMAACSVTGIDLSSMRGALANFLGVGRRFELVGEKAGRRIILDYAHHPTEVAAAVSAARELYPGKHIAGLFQPHLYTRTRDFAAEFAEALSGLDTSVLIELYPAREQPIEKISSETIFRMISGDNVYLSHSTEVASLLNVLSWDILLVMGAGNVDRLVPTLVSQL